MRKHFLILMLFALLPLAGWAAAPISQATVAVGNIEYGQAGAPSITVAIPNVGILTVNQDYTVDGYFTKSGDVYTPVALSALPVNQTAYVKVSGIGSYEGVAYGEFHVSKAKVILSIKGANYFTKVFKGEDPTIVANDVQCTVHGEVYDNTTNAKKATLFLNINNLGYDYGSNQNVTATGYPITFNGITLKDANNYELDITTNARKMYITPATIVSGGLFAFTPTAAVAENTYTYDGLAAGQAPAYGITWNHDNNTQTAAITLDEGTDFEVKYYGVGDNVGSTHKPVNADTYTVKVFGKGNYTTANNNEGLQLANFGFKINKKSLTVMSIAQKKKYDGELFDLSTSKWNIVGRVGDDVNKKVEGLRAEFKATTTVANFTKDVNEYLVEPKYEQIDGSVLNFTSYSAATGGENWGNGTVEVLSLDAEYATVEVKTNSVAGFVGNQYKVAVAGDGRKELLDATTGASLTTPIWVEVTITNPVVARIPAATIGGVELAKNYEITTMNVNWKIEKRPLTITVPGVTMKKGDTNFPALVVDPQAQTPEPLKVQPAAASGETGVLAAEADNVIAAYEVAYDNTEDGVLWVPATTDPVVAAHAMTAAEVQIPGYADAIIANKIVYQSTDQNAVYYDADAADKNAANTALLANYDIQWSKGTLTVNGADFTIMPVVESTIEYGGDYEISYFAYNPITNEEVSVPEKTVAFQINGEDYTKLPTAIGTYTVTIKENTAMGTGDYAGGVIKREVGSFSIVKRHLTLTVKNVKLHKNDPKAILASKADFEISDEDEAVLDKMDEEITLVYSFDTDKVDIDATTNKIKGFKANQDGTDAILAVLALGGDNDHYDIEGYVKGNLTFFDANTLAIVAETDNAKILEAANNGSEDYSVSLEFDRTLAANKWNVMVLPFAVTPYEFTQAIKGYAIFDVLTSVDKENRTFKFTLALDEIPANTPFLVKPLNEVKFKTVTPAASPATEDVISYLTFANRKVEYKEHPGIEVGTTGVKFIGTYKTIDVDYSANPGQFMYMGSKYEFVTCENRTKALEIGSTRAYLDYTGSGVVGARILVEEADGSTTAISSINADGIAVPADGWYTLNGVKLQSAPVEKGVYINNGKKVVIK